MSAVILARIQKQLSAKAISYLQFHSVLDDIQKALLERAREFMKANITEVGSLDEMRNH